MNWTHRIDAQSWIQMPSRSRWILGTGPFASRLASRVEIAGFIDDHTGSEHHLGLPVRRISDMDGSSAVAIAAALRPVSAANRLESEGLDFTDYFALSTAFPRLVSPPQHWIDFRRDYAQRRSAYECLSERLGDDESRTCLDALTSFRLTGDISFMADFVFTPETQYFEEFLTLPPGVVFLDVGAYDGATSVGFVARHPDFSTVVAVEADALNAETTRQTLEETIPGRYRVIQAGAGNSRSMMSFVGGMADRSNFSDEGESVVPVIPLDELGMHGPLFLKMDIEGSEADALTGLSQTICVNRPTIAVAAYHKGSDLRVLPELIDSIISGYEFRFRHYTEGLDETVLFALPPGDKQIDGPS